jgi:hypothetical protein
MQRFKVEHIELRHCGFPPGTPPITFAHLSDLHLKSWRPEHDRALETINSQRVDMVFLTGDVAVQRHEPPELLLKFCRQLNSRHGTFAVRGNWEAVCGPPLRRLRHWVAEAGATLLVNEARTVQTAAGRVRVMGVDDLRAGCPDIDETLAADPQPADFAVLLSHCPSAALMLPPGRHADLVLSGHTHGGQVRLPVITRLVLPACSGPFLSGLYDLGSTKLYVNRGLGTVGAGRLRFNCPAEVAFLRVVPAARIIQAHRVPGP